MICHFNPEFDLRHFMSLLELVSFGEFARNA
jgi:hypothetical protein